MMAKQGCALTNFTEMSGEPDQSLTFNQCFCDAQRNRKPISSAGSSAELVNDSQTVLVNVPENNC